MSTIKVAKPGYNAITDTNPQHFYFNSDYNTFKFLEMISGFTLTVTNDGGAPTSSYGTAESVISLPNLTYTPFVSCAIFINSIFQGYNSGTSDGGSSQAFFFIDTANNTGIGTYTYPNTGTTTTTVTFYPYLFANPV